jgi:hypothetical protein
MRQATRLAQRAPERHALLQQGACLRPVAQPHGQISRLVEGFRPKTVSISTSIIIGPIQGLEQPVAAFPMMPMKMPELAQSTG